MFLESKLALIKVAMEEQRVGHAIVFLEAKLFRYIVSCELTAFMKFPKCHTSVFSLKAVYSMHWNYVEGQGDKGKASLS